MKACIAAVLLLIGADLTLNHGATVQRFRGGIAAVGHSIGEWVFH